jgi:hypothetical protein
MSQSSCAFAMLTSNAHIVSIPMVFIPMGFQWTSHTSPLFFIFLQLSYPMNQRGPKLVF